MQTLRVVCPHCGYSRLLPRDRAPSKPVTATCPQCKRTFLLDPEACLVVPKETVAPPPPSAPAVTKPPPSRGGGENKSQPARPPRSPQQQAALRDIGTLLNDSWQLFQRRFGTLFIVYLGCLLVTIVPPILCAVVGFILAAILPSAKGVVLALLSTIGIFAGTLGFSWGWGACVAASLDEDLDLKASYARSREKIWSFALVTFLLGFIVAGGFLLFIIPGILFSVWFFLAQFVIFDDDTRGMSALLKSKAYVTGHWLDIFLRLLVIWATAALLGAVPVVGPILSLVAAPYAMLYQALLFQDVKKVSGPVLYPCAISDSMKWIGPALLGYIIVPAILAVIFGAAAYRNLAPFLGNKEIGSLADVYKGSPGGASGDSGYRVIPIPPLQPPSTETSAPAPATIPSSGPDLMSQQATSAYPQNIHIFIYSVNYTGSVTANGTTIQELGPKPDMQYNHNMNGEKLTYGKNSITIDYNPICEPGATMSPRLHMKVSFWKGSNKQILGEWEIKDTEAGQKVFDLDIPETLKTQ